MSQKMNDAPVCHVNTWSDSERRPFGLLLCWGWYSGKSFVTRLICLPLALNCSSAVKAAAAAALSLADWAGGVVVSAYQICKLLLNSVIGWCII